MKLQSLGRPFESARSLGEKTRRRTERGRVSKGRRYGNNLNQTKKEVSEKKNVNQIPRTVPSRSILNDQAKSGYQNGVCGRGRKAVESNLEYWRIVIRRKNVRGMDNGVDPLSRGEKAMEETWGLWAEEQRGGRNRQRRVL